MGSNTGVPGVLGSVSMPLHGRLGIEVELGQGPAAWGRQVAASTPQLGVLPGQGAMGGIPAFQATLRAAAPSSTAPPLSPELLWALPPSLPPAGPVPVVFISFSPQLFLFLSSLRHPGALCLCPSALVALASAPPSSLSVLAWSPWSPVSPGACAWVGMGVSLEKSLSAFTPAAGWLSW